ncbi:MAG: hypothetical protein ACLP1X_35375 [Polyangiaceae bacterium]
MDAAYKRAVDAGVEVKLPLADMFWGRERVGRARWGFEPPERIGDWSGDRSPSLAGARVSRVLLRGSSLPRAE